MTTQSKSRMYYQTFEDEIRKLVRQKKSPIEIKCNGQTKIKGDSSTIPPFHLKITPHKITCRWDKNNTYNYNLNQHSLFLNGSKLEHTGLIQGFYLKVAKLLRLGT